MRVDASMYFLTIESRKKQQTKNTTQKELDLEISLNVNLDEVQNEKLLDVHLHLIKILLFFD